MFVLSAVCVLQLRNNAAGLANKMGLQRMRSQRMLKYALSKDREPEIVLGRMRQVQGVLERKARLTWGEPKRRLEAAGQRIEELGAALDAYSRERESWRILDTAGDRVVRQYTEVIDAFSQRFAVYVWCVVALNLVCLVASAFLAREVDREKRRVEKAENEAEHASLDAKMRRFEADILNHRFGNKIRINRLLLEDGQYDQLEQNFEAWVFEVDIRRQQYSNLPKTPINARCLVATEFSFSHTLKTFTDAPLLFYDRRGDQIPYPILQVCFLQDIASNVLKHGGGKADIEVSPTAITVSNNVVINRHLPASTKTGIRALQRLGEDFHIPLYFDETSTRFAAVIPVRAVVAEPSTITPEAPRSLEDDDDGGEPSLLDRAAEYHWMLVEDSPLICALTVKAYKKEGIPLVPLDKPSDCFNLETIVLDAWAAHQKPLVLIMDENVLSLDQAHTVIGETSTNLRRRLLGHHAVRDLTRTNNLFFVSASASDIYDKTVLVNLGKTASTSAQIRTVLHAIGHAP